MDIVLACAVGALTALAFLDLVLGAYPTPPA